MWYFTWVLGIGFAVLLAILNAMWGENEEARLAAHQDHPAHDNGTGTARE
ncbi:MAG TPA: cytochrome bd-I oxidase subunit CydX [Noviherbaspirillum sp.]